MLHMTRCGLPPPSRFSSMVFATIEASSIVKRSGVVVMRPNLSDLRCSRPFNLGWFVSLADIQEILYYVPVWDVSRLKVPAVWYAQDDRHGSRNVLKGEEYEILSSELLHVRYCDTLLDLGFATPEGWLIKEVLSKNLNWLKTSSLSWGSCRNLSSKIWNLIYKMGSWREFMFSQEPIWGSYREPIL